MKVLVSVNYNSDIFVNQIWKGFKTSSASEHLNEQILKSSPKTTQHLKSKYLRASF